MTLEHEDRTPTVPLQETKVELAAVGETSVLSHHSWGPAPVWSLVESLGGPPTRTDHEVPCTQTSRVRTTTWHPV